jgi:hypothetical protein
MIEIQIRTKGVMRLVQMGKSQRDPILSAIAAECVAVALYEWATGQLKTKLADRVGANAFALYGFAARSARYQEQQRRRLGTIRAYFSPRRLNVANVVTQAARHNAAGVIRALFEVATRQPHLADLITRPLVGFMIRRSAGKNPRVQITLPGARVLNRNPKSAIFRQQLLDLGMGGGRDAHAIIDRAEFHYQTALQRLNPPPQRAIA